MPYYEYCCNECGEVFEKMLRISEANLTPVCPTCASPDTHKKIFKVATFGNSTSGSSSTSSNCAPRVALTEQADPLPAVRRSL